MNKYVLLLIISVLSVNVARALNTEQQLEAMRDIYLKEFNKMDDNKDGQLSKKEYLDHQFEDFRAHIIESDGFKMQQPAAKKATPSANPGDMSAATVTMQEMADFDIDMDFDDISADETDKNKAATDTEVQKLTKEDVMPKAEILNDEESAVPEIDLSVSEDEEMKGILEDIEKTPTVEIEKNVLTPEERASQMDFMLDAIKKTLPKQIDDTTTWSDIVYENNMIKYIYKTNLDISTFSAAEKDILDKNIKEVTCIRARQDMCPKVKPMFIDKGINMQIRYFDVNNVAFSSCEFNKETCD